MQVSVVIPALNEEAAIGGVAGEIPRDLVHEIIVVDNGSTDRTAALAEVAGARVVHEPAREFGAAQVPVTCRARLGRSKVSGTLKGSALAGYHLLSTTLRYAWRR